MISLTHSTAGNRFLLTSLLFVSISSGSVFGQPKELVGHKEAVSSVAYSPDGNSLATGSFDRTVKIWDAKTLKETATLEGHTGMVLSVAFTRDGQRILSGSEDNTLRVWNLSPGVPGKEFPALPATGKVLTLSPDGKLLAIAGDDGVARLLDIASLKPIRDFPGHGGPVTGAAFSPDGARLYTSSMDRMIRIFETATGKLVSAHELGSQPISFFGLLPKEVGFVVGTPAGTVDRWSLPMDAGRSFAGHAGEVQKILRHPAGKEIISIGSDKTIHVHDVATGNQRLAITSPALPSDLALSPTDPNLLAVVGEDKSIRVWNLADGKLVASRDGLEQVATAVAFSPDGKFLFVGQADGSIKRHAYPFQPEQAIRPLPIHDGAIVSLGKSADGQLLLTASDDKSVRLWNQAGEPIRAFALFAAIKHAAISPDKQFVSAVGANNELRLWSITGLELKVIPGIAGPITFSADGKQLAFAGADNKVYLLPTALNAEAKPIASHMSPVRAIAFAPAGTALLSAGNDKILKVSEVATGKELANLAGHQAPITSLAISADGKTAVTGSEDKNAMVWDLGAGKASATLAGAAAITGVSFSPDASLIAVASADNQVRIFQAGMLVATIPVPTPTSVSFLADSANLLVGSADKNLRFVSMVKPAEVGKHAARVSAVSITPDGKFLVSAGDDAQVRVRDLTTGAEVRALAHGGPVSALRLFPDGSKVVTGSADKNLRVWNLADGKQLLAIASGNAVVSVAVSKDGSRLALTGPDNITRLHHLSGPELQTVTLANVRSVEFADDGSLLLGAADKLIRQLRPGKVWVQGHGGAITTLAINADGSKVISASADNSVVVRNAADGAAVKPVALAGTTAVAYLPDGVRFLAGGADKILRLVDSNTGGVILSYPAGDAPIVSIATSADSKIAGSNDAGGATSYWSLPIENQPGPLLHKAVRPGPASGVAFLPDQKTIASIGADKIVRLLEAPPPKMVTLNGHSAQIYGVAVSADNSLAGTGGADNKAIVWDLKTLKAVRSFEGHKAQVYSVSFSPDGKQLATSSGDKTVIVWNLADGKPIHVLGGATEALYQVSFSPDGKIVLAAGVDKTPRAWDASTGKEVKAFAGQPDEVYGLRFNATGKRFVTTGYTGGVTIWDFESAKPIHQHKLSFGAYDASYHPSGAQIAVANNDKKVYILDIPEPAR